MSHLHVQVEGSGAPLVLLHGWAMHGGVFAPLRQRLRQRFQLHVVDLPGHGHSRDSQVPLTLVACVEAIAAQVPVAPWVGWSLGGLLALQAAVSLPPRVPALAMLCASPCFVRGPDWRHGVSAEIFEDFAHGLRQDYAGTLERFIALEAFGSDHAREEIRQLRGELFARGEPAPAVLADGLELLRDTDLRPALPDLGVPSLWLAGRRDRLVDARAMAAATELAPDAQLQVFAQAGHAPFLTHADAVAEALQGFLAQLPPSAGSAP